MSPQPQNRSLFFPILMVVVGLALIIGSVWWTLNNRSARAVGWTGSGTVENSPTVSSPAFSRPADLPASPLGGAATTPPPGAARRIPYPHIARVSLAEAKTALDNQQAVFVDARGEALFVEAHIPGAIALTEEEIPLRMNELDKNAWIIPYCT